MRQNRRIVVKSTTPLPVQLDGEMFAYPRDNVRQITLVSLPAALQVMV
jgi:diacylglycerol kinase family enzyme